MEVMKYNKNSSKFVFFFASIHEGAAYNFEVYSFGTTIFSWKICSWNYYQLLKMFETHNIN